jgi:protein-L-isoaspartate O-methyltransferase
MGGSVRPCFGSLRRRSWGGAGYLEMGPYEAIHVGAAARAIPPALVEQLASPGRMIIPVGTYSQKLMQVNKDARGEVTQKDLFGVVVCRAVHLLAIAMRTDFAPYSTCRSQTNQKVKCK